MKPLFKRSRTLLPAGIVWVLLSASIGWAESGKTEPLKLSTRNPFALPKGVYYKVEKKPTQTTNEIIKKVMEKEPEKPVVQLPPMFLQAVIRGGPRRVAVINNQNFVIGDVLFGHELVEIGRDQAVLMGEAGTVVLFLETSPLKVSTP